MILAGTTMHFDSIHEGQAPGRGLSARKCNVEALGRVGLARGYGVYGCGASKLWAKLSSGMLLLPFVALVSSNLRGIPYAVGVPGLHLRI